MAYRLDAHALLSTNEAKDALSLGNDFDEFDSLIKYINGITDVVERYCGRAFLSRTFTEIFDGDGSNRYRCKNMYVITSDIPNDVTIIYKALGETGEAEVPSASIKINAIQGIFFLDDGYGFEKGFQNCKVIYKAGDSEVDEGTKLAAEIMLRHLWKLKDKKTERVSSIMMEGQTVVFKNDAIPPEAKVILDGYRRPRFA